MKMNLNNPSYNPLDPVIYDINDKYNNIKDSKSKKRNKTNMHS